MTGKIVRCCMALFIVSVSLVGLFLLLDPAARLAARPSVEPAAPLTLPLPYLSDANAADAPFGSTPTIDGQLTPGEYAGAQQLTFPTYGGDLEVFIRQDAITLYIALDSPDMVPFGPGPGGPGPAFQVFLDTQHDRAAQPQPDDFRLTLLKNGVWNEDQGTGTGWVGVAAPGQWIAQASASSYGWQGEYAIAFGKLGILPVTPLSIGLALAEVWTPSWPRDWYWPSAGFYLNPSTWGHLTSSSNWSTFYWKPGPYEDYAPSGVPDFDQKQGSWITNGVWTHAGPVAAANSLWWFDSKFETPGHQPPAISDTYGLITSYGVWDDHDVPNVVPFVDDLANNYFGTNQGITGTSIISMFYGTHQYLRTHNLWDDYQVTLVMSPTFPWVSQEVLRSEDVILLLGFYEWIEDPPGSGVYRWARLGGHYVTVAGVDPTLGQIAFSDPAVDWEEINPVAPPPGRVLSGTLLPHQPIPGHPPFVHNDAGNISHDAYFAVPTGSPGGIWGPELYPWENFMGDFGANPHPKIPTEPYGGSLNVQVEVEFALAVSPYTWKASGYRDYAPNGLPDIDQKQDGWMSAIGPGGPQWSFCGPVAAANSLWWFDSKFEPQPIAPLTPNDHYPLIQTYATMPPFWDDHDPLNVDNPATAWPPGGPEFVEDLALRFGTDVIGSGTIITNLYTGIDQYVIQQGLRHGYVITLVQSPDFWWVAEEVERSEDVILLLGFYLPGGTGTDRVGGHYVTVPGVDKKGGYIAFSDPYWDRAERSWPLANVTGPIFTMGRVATGTLIAHLPIPGHVSTQHNDAGNVSHDIYPVASLPGVGGSWGPLGYVQTTSDTLNFVGMNGGGINLPPGLPLQTEVEWAIAVSPVADVWIAKTATPHQVTHGDRITFTLAFSNAGSLLARDVFITDVLPSQIVNAQWSASTIITPISGTRYVWQIPDLAWRQGGTITVTGQISASDVSLVVTNTATIATSSMEQYQLPPLSNTGLAPFTIVNSNIGLTPTGISLTLAQGATATRTITVANKGALTLTWNLAEVPAESWLGETPVSGALAPLRSTPITVTFDATGLSGGAHMTLLRFTSNDPDEPEVDVPITLTVLLPNIDVTPLNLAITLTENITATYLLTVTNSGAATLAWSVAEDPAVNWLSVAPVGGSLLPGEHRPLTATLSTASLISGVYTTTLRFTSNDPNTPQVDVPVTLTVSAPNIDVTPLSLAITLTENITATYPLTVTNSGAATLAWSVAEDPAVNWLSVAPVGGSLLPGEHRPLTATLSTASLTSGVYTTTLRFTSNDPNTPQVDVPVTVTVAVPDIRVAPTYFAVTLTHGLSTTQIMTLTNNGNYGLTWTLTETPTVGWLAEGAYGGAIGPLTTGFIPITFNATGLLPNVYTTTLRIDSSDPDQPQIDIPVSLYIPHQLYLPLITKNS